MVVFKGLAGIFGLFFCPKFFLLKTVGFVTVKIAKNPKEQTHDLQRS
jgi:hypothetical protein